MRSEPVPLIFQFYLYGAIALALLVSLIAVASYRRAVSRNMLMKAGPSPAHRTPSSPTVRTHVPVEPSVDYTDAARRLNLRLTMIYGTAFLVVSAFAVWIRFFTGNSFLIRGSTVFTIWRVFLGGPVALIVSSTLFAAVGIPILAVLLAWHWRRAAVIFVLYVGSWATVAFALLVARQGLDMADFARTMVVGQLYLIGLVAPLPFLLLLVTGNRRVRAVIPMTLAGSFIFCALLVAGLLVPGAVLPSLAPRLWAVRPLYLACLPLISLLVCWRALRVLARFYENKFYSDRQLLADCLSLVVILYVFARLGETPGTAQVLIGIGFIVFCIYRTLVEIALRCAAPPLVRPAPRRLLLLRTFGFRKRTERLFDTIAERWRFHGPVLMIAGPDLAVRTINPADYIRFLSRRLRDRFVNTAGDLQRGVDTLDELPDPDGRYRVNELFCRDDTWQQALIALLDRADVVLMDLRGFSVDNRGCLYELERLVERGPAGQVFLIVDGTTDRSLLDLSIQDAWNRMDDSDRRPGAANLNVIPIQRATARAMNTILITMQEGTQAGVRSVDSHRAAIAAFVAAAAMLLIGLFYNLPRSSLVSAYKSSREIEAAARSALKARTHFDRAVELQRSGDDDGAIAEYRKALAQSPDMADAHHNIGVVLDHKGQFDAAIVEYREAVAANPQQGESHYNLAVDLDRRGDYDAAIAEYRRAIEVAPDLADAHYNLGVDLDRKGDYDAAIGAYRGALTADPDLVDAHYNLGVDLLVRKGDAAAAATAFQKVVALKPESAEARGYLAAALRLTGQDKNATREFRAAHGLNPRSEPPDLGEVHLKVGIALDAKGDREAAIGEYRKALLANPRLAQAHYNLGVDLYKRGDSAAAVEEMRKALVVNPRLAFAHYNIGHILDEKGDWTAAILEYRKALAIQPDFTDARYNLGSDLDRTGNHKAAIAEFRAVLAAKPDLAEAHNALAMALFSDGDAETAIAEFRTAFAHKSDYAEAHYNLGIVLYNKGDIEAAIKEYRTAVALNPDLAEAHHNLAIALEHSGRAQEAEQAFQEAQRLNPALKRR